MEIKRFGVRELLPDTKHYMTYDGSTTMPACHETTTWIILNKPIYITKQQASIAMPSSLLLKCNRTPLHSNVREGKVRRLHLIMQFRSLRERISETSYFMNNLT
ncbi:carbonic anhydrase-related protein 10-like protein [Lasius niger]|uniref:Carbonic anhydrase-related protein 10-like protein n=1 Tax=Lasius niger TaxID=67767 RepID=A0A0J7L6C8_LASNI|nr:carbonic anhydrase-related protein 10-like protein [Lasius niger]